MHTQDITKILQTLMCEQYHTEKTLADKLSHYTKDTSNDQLQKVIDNQIMATKNQINRLERAHEIAEMEINSVETPVLDGLLEEGRTLYKGAQEGPVRDAAIMIALQRITHQNIAVYGSIVSVAKSCGMNEVANLINESLDEEYNFDKSMTKIAEGLINVSAFHEEAA